MYSFGNLKSRTAILRPLLLAVLVIHWSSAERVADGCSGQCSCPPSPPSCPVGVSLVLDACGCCKVCAQQFNKDCGPDRPCDHIKGLRCHLGAGGDPQRGLCRAEAQGRPCEFGDRVYQHGEDFQLNCQYQCSCMDGVIGCMPLCPHQVPLPDWRCANPRLEKPPGRCCERWVCDDGNHINEEDEEPPRSALPNYISTQLQTQRNYHANSDVTFQEWASQPISRMPLVECLLQTTEWSECSSTCGFGISSRVTNNNPDCRLVRETRLCQIRECDTAPVIKRGKKCRRAVRPREPVQISFAGCTTARRYRPRSCGLCLDGRCCRPTQSRTVHLRFHCPDGESITRSMMWIQRCRCSKSFCSAHKDNSAPSVSLHTDIHTFTH
ncbi:cellular communication network factor 1, like 2 [Chanos chanos]|uniref:Cellular communication network factor 1, like 2 n=1 Tax=Chanos chanos TaxID=29144 RepID=A0A6J2USB8_CHACN|nr:CCN family member 1-like [Chanos chanos]